MNHLTKIEERLKQAGCKLTEQRRLILEVFSAKAGHFTAQEIFEMVKAKQSSINFSTIYRNLEILSELNIVHKLNISHGISHYELNDFGHHHHIICKGCGDMKEINVCPYENVNCSQLDELGFEIIEHKFEIYGYCNKCSRSHK